MSMRRCPKCKARDVGRSRSRGTLEKLGRILDLYPYRCVACYHRFFATGRGAELVSGRAAVGAP